MKNTLQNRELESLLNKKLQVELYRDYAPNGLQVEGRNQVRKIVTGVTACQRLLDKAVELEADTILVHHGYFWRNESETITGMKYQRIKTLIKNDINLLGYHLPLDGHPELGNNRQIAFRLGIEVLPRPDPSDLLFTGQFSQPHDAEQLCQLIEQQLDHRVLHIGDNAPQQIKRIAWCSGGGQDYIEQAAQQGFDAFLTGEVSERTVHIAREYGIHFFAAGHHATERYGIKALGEWLAETQQLDVTFVDIDNPA